MVIGRDGIVLRQRRRGCDQDGERQRARKAAEQRRHHFLPRPTQRTALERPSHGRRRFGPSLSDKPDMKKSRRGDAAAAFVCGAKLALRGNRDHEEVSVLGRPGSDLLFQVLRLSTIGAGKFNGRVRDGIGYRLPANTTRPAKDRGRKTDDRERNESDPPIMIFRASWSSTSRLIIIRRLLLYRRPYLIWMRIEDERDQVRTSD